LDLGLVCFLLLDSPLGLRTISFKVVWKKKKWFVNKWNIKLFFLVLSAFFLQDRHIGNKPSYGDPEIVWRGIQTRDNLSKKLYHGLVGDKNLGFCPIP
jgi:hypothetical protein